MMCAILFNPNFQTKLKNFCERYIIIVDLDRTTWNLSYYFHINEKKKINSFSRQWHDAMSDKVLNKKKEKKNETVKDGQSITVISIGECVSTNGSSLFIPNEFNESN